MASKPVKIAILADARDAVKGFDKAGDAAKEAGKNFEGAAEGADTVASKGAQAAGALTGLGDLVGGRFGAGMAVAGTAMQAAADAGDLLNVAIEGGQKVAAKAVGVVKSLGNAETYATAAKKASAVAQAALNVVMSANPIALVVIAIAALVAAFVIAYKKSETFRKIVDASWRAIKAASIAVFNFLKNFISAAFSFIKNAFTKYTPLGIIITHFGKIKSYISGAWNAAKSATSSVWNAIKSAVSGAINSLMSTVRGIKGRVQGAFSSAGSWLLSAGRDLVWGLINGVAAMANRLIEKVKGAVGNAIQGAKNLLGISSPSKVFKQFGEYVGEGLALGIERSAGLATKASKGLAGAVADGFSAPDLSLTARAAFAGAPGASTGGNTYELTVHVPPTANPAETGRAIVKAIDAYEQAGGRRRA